MTQTLRSNVAGSLAALALALGLVLAAAAPSQAQVPELPELPPLQDGLVNVNVSDVVVQLPIAVAANVCEVAVNVLAEQIRDGDAATCTSLAEPGSTVDWNDGNRQSKGQQRGLVNVNVSDIVVQVPIAVAANVCEVAVNVLARQDRSGDAAVCDAQAFAPAEVA